MDPDSANVLISEVPENGSIDLPNKSESDAVILINEINVQNQTIDNLNTSTEIATDEVIRTSGIFSKETQQSKYITNLISLLLKKFKTKPIKISIFVFFWITCSFILMHKDVKIVQIQQVSLVNDVNAGVTVEKLPHCDQLFVQLEGTLPPLLFSNKSNITFLYVWIEILGNKNPNHSVLAMPERDFTLLQNISEVWEVPLVPENLFEARLEFKQSYTFKLKEIKLNENLTYFTRINMKTNLKTNVPLHVIYDLDPINVDNGVIYAAIVLISLYVLIIFEIIHHTLAAMLATTLSITILAALNSKPSVQEMVSWIDIDTILLLFSMMIIVTIFSETGIFDYIAVLAFQLAKGKEWSVINLLCVLTAIISCFLDNVTTALLMTPTTIRLCEVMKMDPVPVLICMLIYSNIGGAITPIGDPPNVIIANSPDIIKSGVTFLVFTIHMFFGVILASITVYLHLKYYFRKSSDLHCIESEDELDIRRTIAVWERATGCVGNYSLSEVSVKIFIKEKINSLLGELDEQRVNYRQRSVCHNDCDYCITVQELKRKYAIKNVPLLIKSGCVLLFVMTLFVLHSIPSLSHLSLGWTALLGVLILLLLVDIEKTDIETIISRVEWSTLIFFASLFILMEALAKLGLIDWIGRQTQSLIMSVGHESRLAVAILLILWVSAVASAFLDNIPLTTMMVRVVTVLASNNELNLPLQPLVWALAFGACLGGNGTLIGSSSNIICAGVAEQHGYKLTFLQYMKIGFPVMITSIITISVYLMLAHVAFQWH